MASDALADAYRALIAEINRDRATAPASAPTPPPKGPTMSDSTLTATSEWNAFIRQQAADAQAMAETLPPLKPTAPPPSIDPSVLADMTDNQRRRAIREHMAAAAQWRADNPVDNQGRFITDQQQLPPLEPTTFDEVRAKFPHIPDHRMTDAFLRQEAAKMNIAKRSAQYRDRLSNPDPA